MKILITGGKGFVAKSIAKEFLKQGAEVVVYKGDMNDDKELTKSLEGVDVVLHYGALTGFGHTEREYMIANTIGTYNLIKIIKEKKFQVKHIIYASTSSVYGGGTDLYENSRVNLKTDYAKTKYAGEVLLNSECYDLNIHLTIFRFSLIYGNGEKPNRIFTLFSNKILNGEEITLNEDGNQTKDFLHIDDVVYLNLYAVEHMMFGTYNVATGIQTSLNDFIKLLSKEYDTTAKVKITNEFREGDSEEVLNISNLTNAGFKTRVGLEKGIKLSRIEK